MPFPNKRRRGRGRGRGDAATRNRRNIQRSSGAKSQQMQLMSLQRQVSAVRQKTKDVTQWAQYAVPLKDDTYDVELPNGAFDIHPLVVPVAWDPLFQAPPDTGQAPILGLEPNKCRLRNMDIQLLFSPKNSELPVTPRIVRIYVLKLKPETAQFVMDKTDNMTDLAKPSASGQLVHVTTSNGGLATMVKFNPACFNVLAYREFLMGNILNETAQVDPDEDQASANLSDPIKRARIKLQVNNVIKAGAGAWRAMAEEQIEPIDQYYLIAHVGGWGGPGVDEDNAIHMNSNIVAGVRQSS